ncbi:PREDICTED: DNA polymerase eta [Dinoponera quadriceps]|uniref:DNA polymerase eta n=1 Tax=Dinoponera quadriceps TaxID=609295 RepID=A0A6P3WTE4_DINQU|nr:PREDICTED: DNA polymerase eta [Dinoponera quadriceps]
MANPGNRIVVLIDMDCFFCQVETKLQPQYTGKPLAVVQYNQWEMGGIIAVNYEARSFGVTRHMRGKEAKEICPNIVLASVPCLRGKADTTRYRKAGREVIEVIRKHCNMIERASVDEAYLDITNIVEKRLDTISSKELISSLANTYIVGYTEVGKNNEEERRQGLQTWILNSSRELHDTQAQKLAVAGVIVEEIRANIYKETGFRCSAGISQNKILAKLACGLHKPNCQTILHEAAVASLYSTLPVKKVRNLGGKFGDIVVESLGCKVMGDLMQYPLEQLQKHFDEKTGLWLYNIARGIDNEPVTNRLLSKSVGACKKFPGKQAITSLEVLKHWAGDLAAEVCERLEQDLAENQRRATLLTVSYHYYQNRSTVSQSRSLTLNSYKPEKIASHCVDVITKSTLCPIAYMGITAGKFIPSKESGSFLKFFKTVKPESSDKVNPVIDQLKTTSQPGGETSLKSNFEVAEPPVITIYDQPPKAEREKLSAIVTSKEESIRNTEESVATTSETVAKESKRIDNSLNIDAEDSPTSKKVFKLMQVCKERNKAKLKLKRMSSMAINNNDFQNSFFMNIFKTDKKDNCENGSCGATEESERGEQSAVKSLDTSNSDLYILENEDENDHERPSSSRAAILVHDSSEKKESTVQNPSTLLREIFPNLDDMDPNILLILPPDLQEEARSYVRSRDKKREKVSRDPPAKTAKRRPGKSKAKRRSPLLDNFLIKTDSSEPLERCAECGQMIPVTRYDEHTDFHIAQNLYREINKPGENSVKRKLEGAEVVVASIAKRQPNNDCKLDRDSRSITTFLS